MTQCHWKWVGEPDFWPLFAKWNCRCEEVFPHGLTSGTQDRSENVAIFLVIVTTLKPGTWKGSRNSCDLAENVQMSYGKILFNRPCDLFLVSGMSCKDPESRGLPSLARLWQVCSQFSFLLFWTPSPRKGRRVVLMRDGLVDPNDKVEDSFKVGISQGQKRGHLGIGKHESTSPLLIESWIWINL